MRATVINARLDLDAKKRKLEAGYRKGVRQQDMLVRTVCMFGSRP